MFHAPPQEERREKLLLLEEDRPQIIHESMKALHTLYFHPDSSHCSGAAAAALGTLIHFVAK